MCVRSFPAIACFLVLVGPSCSNSDNLGLLLDTLKPIHRSVCDNKPVSLGCPTGTSISILVAQYGDKPPLDQDCEAPVNRSCKLPNKLQYMLLQRVVEACQKKPSCQFDTNPGAEDPCPTSRKFVEVSYKCRPFEFRSLDACYEQIVRLSCNPHSRIAIFDVHYGRNILDDVPCPLPEGVPEKTCTTLYAVETVMKICHGKRWCQFVANRSAFHTTTCELYSRPYVSVIYACVPLGVLTARYETPLGKDEIGDTHEVGITEQNLYDDEAGKKWREPYPVLPAADPTLQSPKETTTAISPKKKVVSYTPTNKEGDHAKNFKVFLYSGIGLIAIIIIVIIVIVASCYYNKKVKDIAKNGEMFSTEAPNVFNDTSSDIDNDVEISHISGTFYDPVHPDMILYRDVDGTRNTIRAMRSLSTIYPCAGPRMYGNADYVPPQPREIGKFTRSRSKEEAAPELMTSPKSLGAYSSSQFYYG